MSFSDSDLNLKVEKLKKKYLERRKRVSNPVLNRDHGEEAANPDPVSRKSGAKNPPRYREMKSYDEALRELLEVVSNQPQGLHSAHSVSDSEDELSQKTISFEETNVLCTETDVTLPSVLACSSSSGVSDPVCFSKERLRDQTEDLFRSPTPLGQVYQEMVQIYEKLQAERLSQQAWEATLFEREQQLQQKEQLLLQHQNTVHRLQGVEEEVLNRISHLQQQYQQETETLRSALKEKTKENKRIKSSFDSIKELNDTMKKQLNEVSEQNRRLESQSRKVQARLDNLQRKYDHGFVQRIRENIAPKAFDPKPSKQDLPPPSNKSSKPPLNSSTLKLLSALLDWVVDEQLIGSEGISSKRETDLYGVPPPSVQERCSKVLPVLVEQLHQAEPSLQLPLLRFIYCTLTQLEHSSQHPPLTSTLRRLGEEVSRGPGDGSKTRVCPLFRTACLHTRFLSTLIILKTISQADVLAQALDVLHGDVKTDEGQALFLKYRALVAVLAVLRAGSPGLLAPAVDVLLQMSSESRHQPVFLESCSSEQFFRCVSLLLRNPRLNLGLVEKLSVLLQKLSSIRKNRRLFEVSSLHLFLQEMHQTADPTRAFLTINLSSILFNLGLNSRS
ncbi:coiled-coil domain-containing protein 138 isoform X1 [Astyanax mexicanus]|uniref:Coiled-coil domain-containing protein 138 isoform X1 n=1 Tax=Astyanax mexicanus TaxID=7994 RepID=A0A8T2LGS9_ASTMX|nr:coiled-coil domain-containing protein 138 isoform X1 [Astyanax mexicanus]